MAERLYEYRVRWRREGRSLVRHTDGETVQDGPCRHVAIFQTERGAREKAERLERLEEEKEYDTETGRNPFADMPDLTDPPTIERRQVGEWEPMPRA